MWQPMKSTVLSVLISIQAMILGAPVPWVNEPGFSNQESTPQAKDHKLLMQTKTVKYAMIGWLENKFSIPDAKDYVWKDISQMYWKHNGKAAFETVKAWAVDNPDLEKFGAKSAAPKRRKGKSKEVQAGSVPTQDLVEKLAQCLGLPCDNSSHKRKASSSGKSNDSKKLKSESSEEDSVEFRWYYKGPKTTKEVRNACKEFGIGSAPTIDACVAKLEKHVNTKGKASEELVEKWGEMREVFRVVEAD
jgi:baculoviral IAP repeat-containing protein 6